jgi:hypothetical protein
MSTSVVWYSSVYKRRMSQLRHYIFLWLPSEKYKIVLWKKKQFEDFEVLLVSVRLYFVIAGDDSCISYLTLFVTIIYMHIYTYMNGIVKKVE